MLLIVIMLALKFEYTQILYTFKFNFALTLLGFISIPVFNALDLSLCKTSKF